MPSVRAYARLATGLALALLAALTVLAWRYLIGAASQVPVGHVATHAPAIAFVAMAIAMWSVMMVAMMLPGAAPMIVTFSTVVRRRAPSRTGLAPTGLFVAGYLAVWTGFSVVAAVAQWALHANALLDGAIGRTGPLLGAGLLMVAGVFQWTALKEACLTKCRTPLSFVLTEWRDGWRGAFVMGLRHGAFCVGCCWALMLLMFVGGVMSLVWMGGLAVYMLAEKVVPGGARLSRAGGLVLIAAGVAIAVGSAVPA
jgi:predicted metal-binding membrane protein